MAHFEEEAEFCVEVTKADEAARRALCFLAADEELPSVKAERAFLVYGRDDRDVRVCVEIKILRRGRAVVLHAIDATPARWRGDAGSSPLEHPTHWLISTQVPALLPRLAGPLRAALADPDADVCGFALTVLAPLAELCGAALEQFLDRLLPPVARRCGGRGKLAAAALDALRRVEESCPGAGAKIRRKVPAYR